MAAALLCVGLLVPAITSATYLGYTQARKLARLGQSTLCGREPACIGWRVGACERVTERKFRCRVVETYGVRPDIRNCRFKAVVALFPNSFRVRDGYNHCYNRFGELVAEGPATKVHPV